MGDLMPPPGIVLARSLWFHGPRTAELRRELVPPPGPGQLRVRTLTSAISHGTELLVYRGQVSSDLPLDLPTLEGSFAFPIKYGYAAVGRVMEVGAGVNGFQPGDLVFALHPHQSIFLTPAALTIRLPGTLDPIQGLFLANLETALNVLHDTPFQIGETALVFGQGVIGLLITQLLRLAGAARVIVVEPLALRRALALQIGADAAITPGIGLTDQIRARNHGRLADVAIEVSGVPGALQSAIDCVMDEGTVMVASWYGVKPVTLNLGGHFHRGRVRLRSTQVGHLSPELLPRWDQARRIEAVVSLLHRVRLAELVSHRIAFDSAPSAYELIDHHPADTVQVILTYT